MLRTKSLVSLGQALIALAFILTLSVGSQEGKAAFENGDFERGDFSGWTQIDGISAGLRGQPPFKAKDIVIYGSSGYFRQGIHGRILDKFAPNLVLPRQGNYIARVNDGGGGRDINAIIQQITLQESDRDPIDGKVHIRFSYAAVLSDPGHGPHSQPFFHAELQDLTVSDTLYDDFAYSGQPGRLFYTTQGGDWLATDFIDVDIVIPDERLGHTFELRVLAADCAMGGHGGYVYVDAFGTQRIPPQAACLNSLSARSKPGKIQLTWVDNGAAAYRIYRSETYDGHYVPIGETSSHYATWLDETVVQAQEYFYSVRPVDADGNETCASGVVVSVAPAPWNIGEPLDRPPYFTSTPLDTGDTRQVYHYQALAVDADGDALTFRLLVAPLGMTVNANTGELDWQPGLFGNYRVTLEVSDPNGNRAFQSYSIAVIDGNRPPVITQPLPEVSIPAGVAFSHDLLATDPDGDALGYAIASQADGLVISTAGVVSWASPATGRYPLTIIVSDDRGAQTRQQIVLEVQGPPVFVSHPVIRATVGVHYAYQAVAEDNDSAPPGYALLQAPEGMTINTVSGLIEWMPASTGKQHVKIQASNTGGNTATQDYDILVSTVTNRAPIITSLPVTFVTVESDYPYSPQGHEPDGDTMIWSLKQAPAGMTINPIGVANWWTPIRWRPTFKDVGEHIVEIELSDQRGGIDTQHFILRVGDNNNAPPVISSQPIIQVQAGARYIYTVYAEDPDGELVSYRLLQAPQGMAFVSSQLAWQTQNSDIGVHVVEIEAFDPRGGSTKQRWILEVVPATNNRPPVIKSSPPTTAQPGTTYTYPVEAVDPDGDALTYTLLSSPEEMSVDSAGVITWTIPSNVSGQYDIELHVADPSGASATQRYTLSLDGAVGNRPPRITSVPVTSGKTGTLYTYQVTAADPDGDPLTYALTLLPEGMSISEAGKIEWMPSSSQNGYHDFAVTASDGRGGVSTQVVTLYIQRANNKAPRISSTPIYQATPGAAYQYQVIATDPDNDPLTYLLADAPAGMHINALNLISWDNPVSGKHAVMIIVSDPHGASVSQSYTVRAGLPNGAPQISSIPPTSGTAGIAYQYAVKASDPDGDTLVYHLTQAPSGMRIDLNSGEIAWPAPVVGRHTVVLRVSDGQAWREQTYTLMIHQTDISQGIGAFSFTLHATPQAQQLGDVQPVTLQALPKNGKPPYTVFYSRINGSHFALDSNFSGTYPLPQQAGLYRYLLGINDSAGGRIYQQTWFAVTDGSDTTSPVAEITAPVRSDNINVAEITTRTAIIGTASDANIAEYTLHISPAGQSRWSLLTHNLTSVVDGTLGTLDPSGMDNGLYDLLLTVTDTSAQQSTAQIGLMISGEQKIGQFALSFLDIDIDIGPLPLQLTRTYDTRRQSEALDFGYGWSVSYQDVKVQTNGVVGRAWDLVETGSGLSTRFCLRPAGSRVATVRLPGGKLEKFDIRAEPECLSWTEVSADPFYTLHFDARDGTTSTLKAIDIGGLRAKNGSLVDYGMEGAVVNPGEFELKTRIGTIYTLDTGFGIRQIEDRYGNKLKYTRDGISSYTQENGVSTEGAGLGFTRDAYGRITQISTPDGSVRHYTYDDAGNLLTATDTAAQAQRYTYTPNDTVPHPLSEIYGPDGTRLFKATFDAAGRLIGQTDAIGGSILISHDLDNQTDSVKDRRGFTTSYLYDTLGNVTEITDALGNVTRYTYDEHGNESSITDALGRTTTRLYNTHGDVIEETDALGRTTKTEYNLDGTPKRIIDELGRESTQHYDANGSLTKLVNTAGEALEIAYMPFGSLGSISDPLGHRTTYGYSKINGKRLNTSERDALGHTRHFSYDEAGRITERRQSITIDGGSSVEAVTRQTLDSNGNLLTDTDAGGASSSYLYDTHNQLTEETDALGRTTRHTYNNRGELTQTVYPDGSSVRTNYDNSGNPTNQCAAPHQCTITTYDALNRPVAVKDWYDYTTQTQYDAAGQVKKEIDARGFAVEYDYDAAGRRTQQTDALGNTTTFSYDKADRLIEEADAAGAITTYGYNDRDQRILTTLPDGSTLRHDYDAAGRRIRDTNPAGQLTDYQYDPLGRLTQVTDAAGHATSYGYDERGLLNQQTDALGRVTTYGYDIRGQRVRRTLPGGQSERWHYDSIGRLIEAIDFNGQSTHYAYDIGDRLTLVRTPDGRAQVTEWAYGEVTVVREGDNTLHYSGSNSRPTWISAMTDGYYSSLYQAWDGNNNRTKMALGSPTLHYTYDASNRISEIIAPDNTASTFEYDAVGRLTLLTRPNGVSSRYAYDSVGRLIELTHTKADHTVLGSFTYTLDTLGRRTQVIETLNAQSRILDYRYDERGRLIEEKTQEGIKLSQTDYTYDAAGNRSTKTAGGITTVYAYDANDRLITETTGSTTLRYHWDDNGNLTQKDAPAGSISYTWNSDNRLTRIDDKTTGTQTRYTYDPEGRRAGKTVTQGATSLQTVYVLDITRPYSEIFIEKTRPHGKAPWQDTTYLFTPDGTGTLIGETANGQTTYALQDGLGSTRILTNPEADIKQILSFDAFGSRVSAFGVSASTPAQTSHLYTGERFEPESGFYHLRARDYDPASGRFTSRDEFEGYLAKPLVFNKYLYVNADPVNNIDPSGLVFLPMNIADIGITLNAGSMHRAGSAQAAKGIMKNILLGNPPKDFGIIGEYVIDWCLKAVIDVMLFEPGGFSNKGAMGTKAHQELKRKIDSYTPHKDIKIIAEPFYDEGGKGGASNKKGTLGVDVVVEYKGKAALAFDLKIGRGYSKKGALARQKRIGADVIQIFIKVDGKNK